MKLARYLSHPRNDIGDRAGPRYTLKTFRIQLRVAEPAATDISTPSAAVPVLRAIFADLDVDQEHFVVLAVDTKNHPTGFKVIASGGIAGTIVDPRIVFRSALLLGAASVIVAHNHPSGDAEPSPQDIRLTRTLADAGKLLDLPVLDHIIVANGTAKWVSFTNRKLL